MRTDARRQLAALLQVPVVPPGRLAVAGNRWRGRLSRLTRTSAPAQIAVLEALLGIFDNRVLGVLVSTGAAQRLDRPMSAAELADACGVDTDGLERLLRYAAVRGFVDRHRDGYAPSKMTRSLAGSGDSWRAWVEFLGSDWFWDACRHLHAALAVPPRPGIEASTGHRYFDYVNHVNPEAGDAFNRAMAAGSTVQGLALMTTFDFQAISSICDVGGGTGTVARLLLSQLRDVEVTVLDLPEVIAAADPGALGDDRARCRFVPGNFFESVPDGHDLYLLLAIVHDWSDSEAVALLRVLRDAMAPSARALVVEAVLGEEGRADELTTASDLLMLTLASGRERTSRQHLSLFEQAGLDVVRTHVLPTGFAAYELARR